MILKFKTNKKKKKERNQKKTAYSLNIGFPGGTVVNNAGDGDTRNMGSIPGQEDPLQ